MFRPGIEPRQALAFEEGRHSSRVMEARRELEDIFQREMQQERRLLDGWGEDDGKA